MFKKKYFGVIVALLVFASFLSVYWFQQSPPQLDINETLESQNVSEEGGIIFRTVEGEELLENDILSQDKPVLFYFFTTWCPTCKSDLIALHDAFTEYKDQVIIIVVNFDPNVSTKEVKDYKEEHGYTWIFTEYNEEAITKYKVVTQSSKVGIKNGDIIFSKSFGLLEKDEWRDLLQQLVS